MAFKLDKGEEKEFDSIKHELGVAIQRITEAADGKDDEDKVAAFNSNIHILDSLSEFCHSVASRVRGEWDEKSEKWQESEKGETVGEWVGTWEDVNVETPSNITDVEEFDLGVFTDSLDAVETLDLASE